jgi:spore germination cell wall hydrolase CwlJ-like protein
MTEENSNSPAESARVLSSGRLAAVVIAGVLAIASTTPRLAAGSMRTVIVGESLAKEPASTSVEGIRAGRSSSGNASAHLVADQRCLSEAMYYEARGEGESGEEAVAEVIFHRIERDQKNRTVCAVVYQGADRAACQFAFACDGSLSKPKVPDGWRAAEALAARIFAGKQSLSDATGGATNYHAASVRPRWAANLVRTVRIGNHVFYRSPAVPAGAGYPSLRGSAW